MPPPNVPPPPATVAPGPMLETHVPPKQQEPAKMDSDEIPTGEAKEAAFDTRMIGALIDFFVIVGVQLIVGRLSGGLAGLLSIAYFLTRDALPFLDGQSLGKKAMKTRAVDAKGASLSGNWQASIVRNLAWVIPFFAFVEIYILYSKKEKGEPLRRLGDDWAKTKVVTVPDTAASA
ncbi:RDD family protein [Luteolibacter sp. Populi]|uniref:RDD family protein n=1 Tax=Luteolibacter sp. Populi TaxID=3230487 RepID=UPI003465E2FE